MVKLKRECVTTFLDLMMNCNHSGLPSLVGGTILIFLVTKVICAYYKNPNITEIRNVESVHCCIFIGWQ